MIGAMTAPRAQEIIDGYETNNRLIHRAADDISHEESLLQPPFPANCLNWVLGHLLFSRVEALEALGRPGYWPDEVAAAYRRGSPPLGGADPRARPLEVLLSDTDDTFARLRAALETADEATLNRLVPGFSEQVPVWQRVAGLHWHESYHLGQLDLLRSMIVSRRP